MICLQNVSFSYPTKLEPVFSSFNLTVHDHAWLAVMGPDGSGKTTLGKLIKGLLRPSTGSIKLDVTSIGGALEEEMIRPVDADSVTLHEPYDEVGYLGGDPYDYLLGSSVLEDIVFGMENLGIEPAVMKHRLESALQCTGMEGMAQRLTHTLSGGEQQKLVLAGVLAMGAETLVVDEALSMLDRPTRKRIRNLIASLQRKSGLTIIEMTHDFEDALTADRLIFLTKGRVVYDGSPKGFLSTLVGVRWVKMMGGLSSLRGVLTERGLIGDNISGKGEMMEHLSKLLAMLS